MLSNFELSISYVADDARHTTVSLDDMTVVEERTPGRLQIYIEPLKPISNVNCRLNMTYNFCDDDRVFCNGYQSWTDSREFCKDDVMKSITCRFKMMKGNNRAYGDYHFVDYSHKKGVFHAFSYAYIRSEDDYRLLGSLSEKEGYTIFEFDMNKNTIQVRKDLEGVTLTKRTKIFDICHYKGSYDTVFDSYFYTMHVKPRTTQKIRGYTSWYNYYQNINEEIILRDLNAFADANTAMEVFQIDDGYEPFVGDWLEPDAAKFPNGLKPIVDAIHSKGYKAGLWLAPFGAQAVSKLAAEHPDWFVKDKRGKPLYAGSNWGGFYTLDIYNEEARAYIKKVFDTVLNEWGFDLVKLDFLYQAGATPRQNKSRGTLMCEAIDFLRECVGENKEILACGAPQFPCFGKVEYMRIGSDMKLDWSTKGKDNRFIIREFPCTINAIHNAIYRRHLSGRAFLNDPDVFLLRDYNIQMSFEQEELIAKILKMCGDVLFTSDDISKYNQQQKDLFDYMMNKESIRIRKVTQNGKIILINYFDENDVEKHIAFNVENGQIL